MRALVKRRPEPGLELVSVPEPEASPDDVIVRVRRTGICGTDLHIDAWDGWAQRTVPTPLVIGHEFVGEIVETGANVDDFHPGEMVSGEGHLVCGRCRNCMAGRRHLCARTRGLGVNVNGAFAEYVSVPAANVWRHANGIEPDVAAIFDPFGNAVHSALAFKVVNEDVLITGAGPIGLMAAAVVRHAGARHVVITDPNEYRLDLARRLGVTRAVDPSAEDLDAVQKELGMEEGFDVGLEMSGNPAALRQLITSMAHGGKVALLGIPAADVALDLHLVVFNMLTIRGIYGREIYETWYAMTCLLQSGLDIASVITHRFTPDDHAEAFAAARSGRSGKVVLQWDA
jgi:threonine 3-dehydrogenase